MEHNMLDIWSLPDEQLAQRFEFSDNASTAFEFHPQPSLAQWSTSAPLDNTIQHDRSHGMEEIDGSLKTNDGMVSPPPHAQYHGHSFTLDEGQATRQASQSMGSPANPRKRKAPTLRESDWVPVKTRIIELFHEQNLPIGKVKEIVEREFEDIGFAATIRQYKSRLDQWGVGKNIRTGEMKTIVRKRQQRDLLEPQKKELRFRVRKRAVPAGQINRWMKRHKDNREMVHPSSPIERSPSVISASTISTKESPTLNRATVAAALSISHGSSRGSSSDVPAPSLPLTIVDPGQRISFKGQSPKLGQRLLPNDYMIDLRVLLSLPAPMECTSPAFMRQEEAETRLILHASEVQLGRTHSETLDALRQLGVILWHQGRFAAAEVILEKGMTRCQTVFGESHESTLAVTGELSGVFRDQGRFDRSEKLVRKTSNQALNILGSEHVLSIRLMLRLANLLSMQGKDDEAEAILTPYVFTSQRLFGAEHELTLETKIDLGQILLDQGRLEEASVLFREVMFVQSTIFGPENMTMRRAKLDLAEAYKRQGKYNEAEILLKDLLLWYDKHVGLDHPKTLATLYELAKVVNGQGQFEVAAEMYSSIIVTRSRVLGAEHPSTLNTIFDLARVLAVLGRTKEAEMHFRHVLAAQKRVLRANHTDMLLTLKGFASFLSSQCRWNEAIQIHERACEGAEKEYGPQHWKTLSCREDYRKTLALLEEL